MLDTRTVSRKRAGATPPMLSKPSVKQREAGKSVKSLPGMLIAPQHFTAWIRASGES